MRDEPLRTFLDRLSSTEPTPGGGSAAAVAGAISAALLAMVSRLPLDGGTDGVTLDATGAEMDGLRETLLSLAARDAEVFDGVMQAMRMPRASGVEKRLRREEMQRALTAAAEVPLAVARHALAVLEAAPGVARLGNPNAVSDVGVGALLAHAAVFGALLNVRINLKSITDEGYRAVSAARADELGRQADELRDAAMDAVRERLA